MESSYKFYENKQCKYHPCHKGLGEINCMFCYCPFYAWEKCPGLNEYKVIADGRKIKVCTDCNFPHDANNYEIIMDYLKKGPEAYALSRKEDEFITPCFYGIGVGPGEPQLITLQAEAIIKKVDCLILPAKDKDSCRAFAIARKAIPEIEKKECIFMPFPMSMKEPQLTEFHEAVADKVMDLMSQSKQVGFLTIGDVSIYSTFIYIERIVKNHGFKTEYISGISSFSAAASRVGIPLTIGNDEMHVIPGNGDIDEALNLKGTIVFMKSGRKLKELKEKLILLEEKGDICVYAVANCGMDDEKISHGAKSLCEESGYLTVVIVKKD